jgi:hypothetical protein
MTNAERREHLTAATLAELAKRGTPANESDVGRFVNAGWDERDNDNASEWANAWAESARELRDWTDAPA